MHENAKKDDNKLNSTNLDLSIITSGCQLGKMRDRCVSLSFCTQKSGFLKAINIASKICRCCRFLALARIPKCCSTFWQTPIKQEVDCFRWHVIAVSSLHLDVTVKRVELIGTSCWGSSRISVVGLAWSSDLLNHDLLHVHALLLSLLVWGAW